MERLTLRAGRLEAQVAPAVGGSIARFDFLGPNGRQPLFRPAPTDYTDVLMASCFPLVPFANRIRGGRFDCDGRTIVLEPNMCGDPSPLHGQGWRSAWTVEHASGAAVRLSYRHAPDEWPWSYEATQEISLLPDALVVELRCRNTSPSIGPMPCGLGLHPYYPCDAETMLDTGVDSAWTIDEQVLPVANVPATGRYDLRRRRICAQGLDNGFDGWNGRATIAWPGKAASLSLSSDDAQRFQVYSPPTGAVFVAEPVQNANAALNAAQAEWPQLGIAMLDVSDEASLEVIFTVSFPAAPST
jgi:aldose 1-epimerase